MSDKGIKTIFKCLHFWTLEEIASERPHIIEHNKDSHGYEIDENTPGSQLLKEGCRHCRRTLDDLIQETLYENESLSYQDEKVNLNIELKGTLYALQDFYQPHRNTCKRMTQVIKVQSPHPFHYPYEKNSDNLNLILSFHNCDYLHVWYDETDGDVHSVCIDHDGRSHWFYREFQTIELDEADPRFLEWGYRIERDGFEEMLYNAKSEADWKRIIQEYTKPVGPSVAGIYGWQTAS
jgi:hypothetical protein